MSAWSVLLLVGAGVLAGIFGSVGGLASLASYPALLLVGLPPTAANVTNSVALVATTIGAAGGSRPELVGQGRRIGRLCAVAACGGAGGAMLLLTTPPGVFEKVVPWLVAGASVALLLSPRLRRAAGKHPADRAAGERPAERACAEHLGDRAGGECPGDRAGGECLGDRVGGECPGDRAGGEHPVDRVGGGHPVDRTGAALNVGVFLVAVYAGYFGAAAGVLMLALLTAASGGSLARVNAAKNLVSGAANAVAAVVFALIGPVHWVAALALAAGSLAGGWLGPAVVRRLPAGPLRVAIAVAGLGLAVKLAADAGTF